MTLKTDTLFCCYFLLCFLFGAAIISFLLIEILDFALWILTIGILLDFFSYNPASENSPLLGENIALITVFSKLGLSINAILYTAITITSLFGSIVADAVCCLNAFLNIFLIFSISEIAKKWKESQCCLSVLLVPSHS